MLSYQHSYHAGNHADILKHLVLCFVLGSLKKKDKPFTYFDTHSGSGLYDLFDNRSCKTGEAERGIKRLFEHKNDFLSDSFKDEISGSHHLVSDYLSLTASYLSQNVYPGSPEIARALLRKEDFLVLSELHPREIENLRENLQKNPFSKAECENIQIHHRNGFEMLNALTPPKIKRGAVLIDPSYEESADYTDVAKTICAVNKKWQNGIIMLWYPLLAHRQTEINQMLSAIEDGTKGVNPNVELCRFELCVAPKDSHKEMPLKAYEQSEKNPPRLYGSGMFVINAPWNLKEEVESTISMLEKILS